MSKRRVVVTGLGIISPVGVSVDEAWANVVAGRGGITRITRFDPSQLPVQFAGEVKNFDVAKYLTPKEARRMDTFIQYGLAAAMQAVQDSGLTDSEADAERIGINIGSGIGGLPLIEENHSLMQAGGWRKISPFFIPGSIINLISGNLSIHYGFKGPNLAMVSACTTATHCIGDAGRMIQYGDADVMVAGGAESTVDSPLCIAGFAASRALSTRNDDPATASRPFDKDRDGFVIGEGAGILVLEEYEHAKARGAKIYCELVGFGMSGDAHHITAPMEDGDGARRAMANALKDAGINPDQVDAINAHATSTPLGDIAETIAIKRHFGYHANKIAISATKSMTGHLLGAAGGVEAVFSILSMNNGVAPPTINIFDRDPQCDLDYVPNTAREMKIDIVASNSFGFGGTNGTLIFRKI